jgi:hypothetical protein
MNEIRVLVRFTDGSWAELGAEVGTRAWHFCVRPGTVAPAIAGMSIIAMDQPRDGFLLEHEKAMKGETELMWATVE